MPVPISTTARASRTEARKHSAAPAPEPIGDDTDLLGARACGGQDLVLGDVLLGVGPGRGLRWRDDDGLLTCGPDAPGPYPRQRSRQDDGPAGTQRDNAVPGSFSGREQTLGWLLACAQPCLREPSLAWCHGEPLRRLHDPTDQLSWEQIVTDHSARVYRLAYRLTGQQPRRRGPDPGGVRAGLPLAAHLHPGHHGGLAAPDHHEPLPRPGPPQAADPLRRPQRRGRRPAAERAAHARRGPAGPDVRRRHRGRAGLARPRLPRRGRALRRGGPQLRGDRRRAGPQARHRPLAHPPRSRPAARRARPPRPDRRPHPLRRSPPQTRASAGQVR